MAIKTVYCDMDGVLVDFRKGAEALDAIEGTKVDWKKIKDAGAQFWADLEWKPEGKKLWNWLVEICDKTHLDLCILSAVNYPEGEAGKKKWIIHNLNGLSEHNVYMVARGVDKAKFANNETILIDDFGKNIEAFIMKNGNGIKYTNFAKCQKDFMEFI